MDHTSLHHICLQRVPLLQSWKQQPSWCYSSLTSTYTVVDIFHQDRKFGTTLVELCCLGGVLVSVLASGDKGHTHSYILEEAGVAFQGLCNLGLSVHWHVCFSPRITQIVEFYSHLCDLFSIHSSCTSELVRNSCYFPQPAIILSVLPGSFLSLKCRNLSMWNSLSCSVGVSVKAIKLF
jgi:hypothetical protein